MPQKSYPALQIKTRKVSSITFKDRYWDAHCILTPCQQDSQHITHWSGIRSPVTNKQTDLSNTLQAPNVGSAIFKRTMQDFSLCDPIVATLCKNYWHRLVLNCCELVFSKMGICQSIAHTWKIHCKKEGPWFLPSEMCRPQKGCLFLTLAL